METKYLKENFNVVDFNQEIGSLKDKVSGYKHQDGKLIVYLSILLTPQDKADLDQFVLDHDGSPKSELRVYRVLPKDLDPLISDFTILGFRKIAPHYDRGRKVKAEYKCVNKDEMIVEKIFTDIRDPQNARLTDLEVLFNWYDEDGNIGLTKTEIVKTFNKAQAETEERNRRERAVDFLISEGKDTPLEPVMSDLFSHYHSKQLLYKETGSDDFLNAMNNETDPTILAYLDIRVPFTSDPNFTLPIRESIQYQIHAIDEADLITALLPAE